MAVVVVGGHTRNIGKTTLATQILASTRQLRWTAIKITQFGHNVCSANGEPCDCSTGDHAVAISEERNAASGKDTSRMLAMGSRRVLWVRTQQGALHEAMPRIRKEIAGTENVLIESNSILRFVRPDLYLAVLQPTELDFKVSALRYLDRADALFVPDGTDSLHTSQWPGVSALLLRSKPVFPLYDASLAPEALVWLSTRLTVGSAKATPPEARSTL